MLSYQPTPIQEISDKLVLQAGLSLFLKREDLNHPFVSGNKWWKLKYNLEEAIRNGKKNLLTYGGAYSNHIYATAAAAHELRLDSVGIIRGEETLPLNPTLSFAKAQGMRLHYISREAYRSKTLPEPYRTNVKDFYVIPEGGTNALAIKGVCEFALTLPDDYDYLCCPVGTGGTLAGLIQGTKGSKKIVGFPALRGSHFLNDEIKKLCGEGCNNNWQLLHDYHFGGYAKASPELLQFIDTFKNTHHIPLEYIYTAKMMAGIYDLISKGFFSRGASILVIHTGGLQINKP